MSAGTFAKPIRSTRTFEAAIANIVEGIERQRLRQGDRIPNETELAVELGISKPTLRQALRILEQVGLVTVRRGKGGGIFVASDLIPVDAISRGVALEAGHVIDVLRGRRILETAVTAAAMHFAEDEDYEELEHTLVLLREHVGDRRRVMQVDAKFHRAVARSCHNATLQAAMKLVADDLAPIRDAYSGGHEFDLHTVEIHTNQVDAMRRGDLGDLLEILDEHFRLLEEAFARVARREWAELFGDIAGRMRRSGAPALVGARR